MQINIHIFFLIFQPNGYVCYLIQHEGKGSLFSSLKNLGFVNSLSAYDWYYDGFGFFEICCGLTEDGIGKFRLIFVYRKQFSRLVKTTTKENCNLKKYK